MNQNGKKFEKLIVEFLKKYENKNKCFFLKSPTPTRLFFDKKTNQYKMTYAEKALCDFIIVYEGKLILIEAKYVSGTRFDLKRIKEHQIYQLSSIRKHGGYSWIFFDLKILNKKIMINIEKLLIEINQTKRKSISVDTIVNIGQNIKLNNNSFIEDLIKD